jgi:hypothetical protein
VNVRIGVTYSPKELEVELADGTGADEVKATVEEALGGTGALWLTDRRGRQVAVPVEKVAYVEISGPDDAPRIGFGA